MESSDRKTDGGAMSVILQMARERVQDTVSALRHLSPYCRKAAMLFIPDEDTKYVLRPM